jgi:germacradienol/geosmin synthase
MLESWLWELANHIQQRIPDPIDYIEMRRRTFGSDLTMDLGRITKAGTLPAELLATRTVRGMENAAADYACFINDVFSYQKEIEFEGELHNIVLVVQQFLGIDRRQAVQLVNQLMTARMRQFEHIIATELPGLAEDYHLDDEDRAALDSYVLHLQDWMVGILEWHMLCRRYGEQYLLARYRKSPQIKFAGPTGLGVSASIIGLLGDLSAPV